MDREKINLMIKVIQRVKPLGSVRATNMPKAEIGKSYNFE